MSMFSMIICIGLGLITTAFCQQMPTMAIKDGGNQQKEFSLKSLEVYVRAHGPLAETTMTMVFHNPHSRNLEGELNFPLPEGATVSGYALDINGKLVDGVIVEKHKGRKVFEAIVRQGIDPGLVEKNRGNNFKTRVFPMPPKGERTIRVTYVAELARNNSGSSYHLPLTYNHSIPKFSLRMEVVNPVSKPTMNDVNLANFEFDEWHSGFFAETTAENIMLTNDLRVAIPQRDGLAVYTERAPDGERFFMVHDRKAGGRLRNAQAAPKRITLLWDTSASHGNHDHVREISMLRNYFMALKKAVTVQLIGFNIYLEPVGVYQAGPSGCERLLEAIDSLRYDGGTRLSILDGMQTLSQPDFLLMVSDGLSTFGNGQVRKFDRPLFTFCNTNKADHDVLKSLSIRSGGRYFNLKKLTDVSIIPRIGKAPYSFTGASLTSKDHAECYPARPVPVTNDFVLAGKLTNDSTQVTIRYGSHGASSKERTFRVSADDAIPGTLLRRYWAQSKIQEISFNGGKGIKEKVTAIGTRYGIVTSGTSLIVLERLQQYVHYDIMPPESLPKMRAAYVKQKKEALKTAVAPASDPMDELAAEWKDKVEWWMRTYTYREISGFKNPVKAGSVSVHRPLTWLQQAQHETGFWGTCEKHRALLTGLSLINILSRGETPLSEQYGWTVQSSMRWLANQASRENQVFIKSDDHYCGHTVATYALAESYAMTRIPFLKPAVEKSLSPIIENQKVNGAFALGYQKSGENHVLFTALNAATLKAGKLSGCNVPGLNESLGKCKRALKNIFFKETGFSSNGTKPVDPFSTAAGICALQLLNESESKECRTGIATLKQQGLTFNLNANEPWPILRHYAVNCILFNNQSKDRDSWQTWRTVMERTLTQSQENDGFWPVPEKSKAKTIFNATDGKLYATNVYSLFMTVYYRYLPTLRSQPASGARPDTDDDSASARTIEVVEIDEMALEEEILEEVEDVAITNSPLEFPSVMGGRSDSGRAQSCRSMASSKPALPKKLQMTIAEVNDAEVYMKHFNNEKPEVLYDRYSEQRTNYKTAPAFYLDCADLLIRKGRRKEGIKVLSNICELKLDDSAFTRIVARKLEEVGEFDLAITSYEQLTELRPEEPQSFRDLALALELRALSDTTRLNKDLPRAIEIMKHAVKTTWSRFQGIQKILLVELNRMMANARKHKLNLTPLQPRFATLMTPDIRVVLNWDEDNTDMDLWVIEPTNEKCYYSFRNTRIGGRISDDVTNGYGPEEYMLRKAIPGTYQVKVKYYGSSSAKFTGAITLKLDIYRNYGRANEQKQTIIRRLKGSGDTIDICTFSLDGKPVDVIPPKPPKKETTPDPRINESW